MTQDELAARINKGKSTLSKYEKGDIVVDIETLYELASILHVHVEQLLYQPPAVEETPIARRNSTFFENVTQFYSYLFDGRSQKLIRCVFDITSTRNDFTQGIRLYMNFEDYKNYRDCETTYYGYIEHFDALTNIMLTNEDSPIEKASAHILASYQKSDQKWGLFNGISSRPVMPISIKMLFSKTRLEENNDLIQKLIVSKEDIRLLKMYNMMAVMY